MSTQEDHKQAEQPVKKTDFTLNGFAYGLAPLVLFLILKFAFGLRTGYAIVTTISIVVLVVVLFLRELFTKQKD